MTRRWLRAPLLAVTLLFVLAAPVLAARNTLSNPTVSPTSGTPATTFTFTVRYDGAAATSVTVSAAGRTIAMALISGTSSGGTFAASTTLPVGAWPVTFHAVAQRNDDTLVGPTVAVTGSATPRPTTAPTATPSPPPAATPVPTRPPPPITATPLPPTPVPSPTASEAGSGSAGASGFIGGFILTPAPTSTPAAEPAAEVPVAGDEMWTLLTGGLIAVSALALLGMVGILRARRPPAAGQPIGPAKSAPPPADE